MSSALRRLSFRSGLRETQVSRSNFDSLDILDTLDTIDTHSLCLPSPICYMQRKNTSEINKINFMPSVFYFRI